jgi:hypothetical protein
MQGTKAAKCTIHSQPNCLRTSPHLGYQVDGERETLCLSRRRHYVSAPASIQGECKEGRPLRGYRKVCPSILTMRCAVTC